MENNLSRKPLKNLGHFEIFSRVTAWFDDFVFNILKADRTDLNVIWKYAHTTRVTRAASNIFVNVAPYMKDGKNHELVCIAAFLHDIARFENSQKKNPGKREQNMNMLDWGYGDRGAEILHREFFPKYSSPGEVSEEDIVIFMVQSIDKTDLTRSLRNIGSECDTSRLWLLAETLRDADRVDNFLNSYTEKWWRKFDLDRQNRNNAMLSDNRISESMWERFKEHFGSGMHTMSTADMVESAWQCFDISNTETLGDAMVSALVSPILCTFSYSQTVCRKSPNFNNIIHQLNKEDERTIEVMNAVISLSNRTFG